MVSLSQVKKSVFDNNNPETVEFLPTKRDKEKGPTIATQFIVLTVYLFDWLVKMKIRHNETVSHPTVCIASRGQWTESGMWEGSVGQPHKLALSQTTSGGRVPHLCRLAPA